MDIQPPSPPSPPHADTTPTRPGLPPRIPAAPTPESKLEQFKALQETIPTSPLQRPILAPCLVAPLPSPQRSRK